MKNMKRSLIVLLALMMVLSLFAGCGTGGEKSSAPTDSSAAATSEPAPVEETDSGEETEPTEEPEPAEASYFPLAETKTLTFWISYPPFFNGVIEGPSDYPYYIEAQKRLNVNLEFTEIPLPSAREQFSVMLASEEYHDLMYGFSSMYTGSLDEAVESGIILELTDLVDQFAPDYKAIRESTDENIRQTTTSGGKLAMFYYFQGEEGYYPDMGPVIRADWLEAQNLDIPHTYADYENVLSVFKTEYNATFGLPCEGMTRGYSFMSAFDICLPWSNSNSGFYHIDNEVYWGPASEGFGEYVTKMHEWYEAGYIDSDFVSDTNSGVSGVIEDDRIASSEVGIFVGRSKDLKNYSSLVGEGSGAHFVGSYAPLLTEGQTTHVSQIMSFVNAASSCAIGGNCADPELATRFLNYWYSEEGNLLANYGVQGLSFDYDDDGNIYFTDLVTNNPDGLTLDAALAMYTGASSGVAHLFDNTKWAILYDEDQIVAGERWGEDDDGAYVMTAEYKSLLNDDEIAGFSTLNNDLNTYFKENIVKFITGERSLDTLDEYFAELESMGVHDMEAMMTAAWQKYVG